MVRKKSFRDPGNLRMISMILLLAGAVIIFRIPVIRMAGYVFLGAGAFGLIWSLLKSEGKSKSRENEDHRKFF